MKFSSSFVLLGLSLAAGQVHGWGMKGYEAVGFIAMKFLAPEASRFVETSSSGPQYYSSLGLAAAWADEVRRQKGYGWSAPLHFVDAEDHPPTECSVNQKRNCSRNGCILTAIANYTSRVVDTTLSDSDRQEALKFIISWATLGNLFMYKVSTEEETVFTSRVPEGRVTCTLLVWGHSNISFGRSTPP